MSCGNPTTEEDALMTRRQKYDRTKTCIKCKENPGNIVIRHIVYCRDCFVSLTTFKFRRALEPFVNVKPNGPRHVALKPAGNLLVGFSGGLGSTVLLDLVNKCYISPDKSLMNVGGGRDHPRNERVWKKVTVCYIEVSDVIPGSTDRTEQVREAVDKLDGVEFLPLRVQAAFDSSWWGSVGGKPDIHEIAVELSDEGLPYAQPSSKDALETAKAYLASLPTPTAFTSTLETLVRVLLQHTAIQTGSSHLLLGTSLTSLAVSLISGVSQGAGFHVKELAQEEWFPAPHNPLPNEVGNKRPTRSVRVIRPLRDIGAKECAIWAWWMSLSIIGRDFWRWPGAKAGIGQLTKEFVMGLEKDYPSTVSTIVRTCAKLAPKGETSSTCLLCERPIQDGVQEWKMRIAIRSRNADQGKSEMQTPESISSLAPNLCYVCHTTFTSKGSRSAPQLYTSNDFLSATVTLPMWTSGRLRELGYGGGEVRKMNEREMHDVVKDYLLE